MKDATALLRELQPYLGSIVCYASSVNEHLPNRIVRDIEELLASPSIETTGTKFTPETLRRAKDVMKANDGKTSYTVARDAGAHTKAQEWLIAPDEVKMILDTTVRVGHAEGKNMVFNKRDAANKIAQIVNDRYNAKKAT